MKTTEILIINSAFGSQPPATGFGAASGPSAPKTYTSQYATEIASALQKHEGIPVTPVHAIAIGAACPGGETCHCGTKCAEGKPVARLYTANGVQAIDLSGIWELLLPILIQWLQKLLQI